MRVEMFAFDIKRDKERGLVNSSLPQDVVNIWMKDHEGCKIVQIKQSMQIGEDDRIILWITISFERADETKNTTGSQDI